MKSKKMVVAALAALGANVFCCLGILFTMESNDPPGKQVRELLWRQFLRSVPKDMRDPERPRKN